VKPTPNDAPHHKLGPILEFVIVGLTGFIQPASSFLFFAVVMVGLVGAIALVDGKILSHVSA
jgi:hypothetical protein